MSHLQRYIEEQGILYPEQLAEALRRQQIYGGSLDTVLLELELVDPVSLGGLLEKACGFPVAPPQLLDNGLQRPWDLIPEPLQRSHWVEPLSVDGDEIVVAVHPDLPDDMLGGLLRSVRRMRPMVTPECCLEKVAAERNRSVVPQRYAVLCASYLSAVRRRPSMSGSFTGPDVTVPAPTPAPAPTPTPTPTPTPADTPRLFAPPPRPSDSMVGRSAAGSIDVREPAPFDAPLGAPPEPGAIPPIRKTTLVASSPPVTPRGTLVATHQPAPPQPEPAPEPAFASPPVRSEADLRRRFEQARRELEAVRSRDEALEAIVAAACVISPRVAVFRVRGNELVGLSMPGRGIADVGGKVVSTPEGSAAGIAMNIGLYLGEPTEPDLRMATGASESTPCALRRVEVRGRAVVLIYLDRDGAPIDDLDAVLVAELANVAGRVFEEILKLRRSTTGTSEPAEAAPPAGAQASPSASVDETPSETETEPVPKAFMVPPVPEAAPTGLQPPSIATAPTEVETGPAPSEPTPTPAPTPTPDERGWGPPTPRVRAAYGEREPTDEPLPVEPVSTHRMSTPELEYPEGTPPSPVPPPVEPPEPGQWRLTPELAASAPIATTASTATPELEAPPLTVPEDDDEPPASLQDEDIPVQLPTHPVTPEEEVVTHAPLTHPPITDLPITHMPMPHPTGEVRASAEEDETSFSSLNEDEPTVVVSRREPSQPLRAAGPDSEDVTHVRTGSGPLPAAVEVGPASKRPTMEISVLGESVGSPHEAPVPHRSVPDSERSIVSRATMHSTPPPPPLPPPPPSAFEEEQQEPSSGRRKRASTISGLPPPELSTRVGATKRMGPSRGELPIGDEEVDIISLARPITPATARGRIELEDEDWMPSGAPLASDSQQAKIDAVIERVLDGRADVDDLRTEGPAGLQRMIAQFPGPLEVMRRDLRSLPPPSAHGPLIRAVIAMGPPIVPHLIDLFEHPNPDIRFYAAFVFHELRDTRCMRPLAKLAFDANGDVRIVSMRVLETYRRSEGFDVAASIVREQLGSETRTQQLHAARAAGTLRDIGAVPQLIDLLSAADRFIQEASLESLCSITGQQHGLKPHRWRAWYEDQGHLHRVEWIIDSLRHRDLPVRRWAADELVRITGHRVPFSPMGDKRAREVAVKAWTDWWNSRGRDLFGAE